MSSIIEVSRNHTKPKKRQWMKLSIIFPVKAKKKKKKSECALVNRKMIQSYGYRKCFHKSLLSKLCSKVFKTKRRSQKVLI